ncbi:MAG TPA: leucine/isoleucine/valine transporter permease subunit, partial [Anaerolineae bacterium]|nr:leucine/isoleucine/valine transporter permease subunit [Anaerolineae bacterium]
GGISGLVMGGGLAFLAWLVTAIDMSSIFVNATEELVNVLTFGQGLGLGIPILLVLGLVGGMMGSFLYTIPPEKRDPYVWSISLILLIGLLQDLFRNALDRQGRATLRTIRNTLFSSNGMTWEGTAVVSILVIGWVFSRRMRHKRYNDFKEELDIKQRKQLQQFWRIGLGVLLLALPWIVGRFPSEILVLVGLYIIMGLGLNIEIGFTGLLDIGFVAFYAIGAYSMALLTSPSSSLALELSFWAALPITIVVNIIFGIIMAVPVLRMRGDYLAIVTLGYGQIVRFILGADDFREVLGAAQGILRIPKASIGTFEFDDPQSLYYLVLAGCAITYFISYRLQYSRVGRAWNAMREDETVAEAMGINIVNYKILAFMIGASFAAVSGAIFAAKVGSVFPNSFTALVSITVLSLLIIGGSGNLMGVVVGALVMVGLPQLLREFAEYQLWFYGLLLVVMMLVRPEGLLPPNQGDDIEDTARDQDAWLKMAGFEEAAAAESIE